MQVGALQNEKLKKMSTPVGTAKISKSVFKVGKLKMTGANMSSCSQYYKVLVREPPQFTKDYLEITRRNVALLKIN